jgi:hypothetical protein
MRRCGLDATTMAVRSAPFRGRYRYEAQMGRVIHVHIVQLRPRREDREHVFTAGEPAESELSALAIRCPNGPRYP